MVKDKHIISEIGSFFPKNDCNRAINCLQRIAFADENKYITLAMRYSTISAEQLIEYACENSGIGTGIGNEDEEGNEGSFG